MAGFEVTTEATVSVPSPKGSASPLRFSLEQGSSAARSIGPVRFQDDAFISRLRFGKRDDGRIRYLMLNSPRAHALCIEDIHLQEPHRAAIFIARYC